MIYCGDASDCLEQLTPASIHTCIAHPPYWQAHEDGDLGGERNFNAYLSTLVSIFKDVHHSLISSGDLWLIVDTLDIVMLLKASGWFHAHTCQWQSNYILHFYATPQRVRPLEMQWNFPQYDEHSVASLQYYTPLPSTLVAHCIQLSTVVGDTVLDLFSGTGVTTLTAHKLARHTVSIDNDPIACAMLEARLNK